MKMFENISKKLFGELPLDYQQGYQDGFNGCLEVMRGTLKKIGKLDIKAVQKVHKPLDSDLPSSTQGR